MILANIRLHRPNDINKRAFYWDITTGKEIATRHLPKHHFAPEQQRTRKDAIKSLPNFNTRMLKVRFKAMMKYKA